jgi:phospholipid transport system substrate-binding protein
MSAVLLGLVFVIGALLDAGQNAQAQAVPPDALLKSVTSEVIAVLQENRSASQPTKVADLVEAKVLPLFDFPRMTSIAVALSWRSASPAQQKALTAEFKTLLVRTYSVALSNYRDQRIDYLPLRAAAADTELTVRSMVRQSGAEPLSIDYEMEQTPSGWQVYDIKIAGVSLVINYRASFAAEVRATGVDGLIKSLSDKNAQSRSTVR